MNNDKILAKSTFWYTIGNFASRALVFLATPIYIRFLSVEEYGLYSNFASWLTILSVSTGMNLQHSILKARYEYEDDLNSYLKSIYLVIAGLVAGLGAFVLLNLNWTKTFLNMGNFDLILLFAYLFAYPGFAIATTLHRSFFRMKSFIIATLVQISATVLVSVALLLLVPGRRLEMLIIGQTLPASIIGLYFLIRIFLQEGRPKKVMLTNAVKLGIPMIPHTLGGVLLDRSDRVMITNLVGEAQTAYYSVGANVSTILIVVSNSLNNAFIPWLTGSLSKGEQDEEIKKNANRQILLFSVVVVAVLLLAPEIVFFFGGRNYQSSVAVMVPLLLGAYFHHVYVMYMNLEYYNRRTRGTVISTTIVAVLNIVLNYMFIPRYGFAAAAYTTLFCYVVRYFLHVGIAKRINMDHVYDNRKILIISLILLLSGFLFSFLYTQNIIRYLVIAVAAVAVVFLMIKNKEIIKAIFSREK